MSAINSRPGSTDQQRVEAPELKHAGAPADRWW